MGFIHLAMQFQMVIRRHLVSACYLVKVDVIDLGLISLIRFSLVGETRIINLIFTWGFSTRNGQGGFFHFSICNVVTTCSFSFLSSFICLDVTVVTV